MTSDLSSALGVLGDARLWRMRHADVPPTSRKDNAMNARLVVGGVRVRLDGLLVLDCRLLLVVRVSCSTDRDYPCP